MVQIYTDGSCSAKSQIGGFGVAVFVSGELMVTVRKGYTSTTTGRMELMAAVVGAFLSRLFPHPVSIISDSQYVVYSVSKGWLRGWLSHDSSLSLRKNGDLWLKLLSAPNVDELSFHWVRGHSGNAGNELADFLARESYRSAKAKDESLRSWSKGVGGVVEVLRSMGL